MIGDLYISSLDVETGEMGVEFPNKKVELMTQKVDYYGLVVRAGDFVMLSPEIEIGQADIRLCGSVLQSPNFSVYQEWRFVPTVSQHPYGCAKGEETM